MKQLIIECVDFEFGSCGVGSGIVTGKHKSSGNLTHHVLFNEMFYDIVDVSVKADSFSEADLMLAKRFKELEIVDSKDFNNKYDVVLVSLDTKMLHTSDHMINHLMSEAIKHCEGVFAEFLTRHGIEFKTLERVNGANYKDIVEAYSKNLGV